MLRTSVLRIVLRTASLSAAIVAVVIPDAVARAQSFTVPDWTADSIHSAVLGETRKLSISLPGGYDVKTMAGVKYPVLIVLDESYSSPNLATTIMTARQLGGMEGWLIPPMIIVSVQEDRNYVRDMTPPPVLGQPSPRPGRGGAPAFATFVADELLPWLGKSYRVAPYTIVQGHSLGGLFAAWVYGYRPDKIDAVLALSPTIIWSDESYQQILNGIRGRTRPGRFFIAASEDEGTMIPGKTRQFLSDVARTPTPMTTVLHQWYSEAAHSQTAVLGFTDGLRAIFRPVALSSLGSAMSKTEVYLPEFERQRGAYRTTAPAFGLSPRMPAFFTLNQALTLATPDYLDVHAAIPVLCDELRVSYPELWAAPLCDGHVRLGAGNLDGAASAFAEALGIAQRSDDPIGISQARQGAARVEDARRAGRPSPPRR